MTKQEAREWMKQKRSAMSPKERQRQNEAIVKKLFASDIWQQIDWFYPFVSYGTEVDTIPIIRQAFALDREGRNPVRVAVPRVHGREMDFYEIHSLDDLEPGYHGILEPKKNCQKVEAREGLMLLPGLAFDQNRNRVGYGGGYYDRYLDRHGSERLLTWAVAYDFQVVDVIEMQEHDVRPQKIITAFCSQIKHRQNKFSS